MKSSNFVDYLESIFGKKSSHVFEKHENEVFLRHPEIDKFNEIAEKNVSDKCQRCPAKIYRQDLPFWTGGHKNKPLMVISQDAGKGAEEGKFNTVFTIHQAYLDRDSYVDSSARHKRYLAMFEEMTGTKEFFGDIYFTDVIKCAFSTENNINPKVCTCSSELLFEIKEVNPKVVVLMGKPAQERFKETLSETENFEKLMPVEGFHLSTAISSRNGKEIKISVTKYNYEGKAVFFIPHLSGNLHISKEYTQQFNSFRSECLSEINKCLSAVNQRAT